MDAVLELAPGRGLAAAACAALGVSRASLHRRRARRTGPVIAGRPRPSPRRALAAPERQAVLDLLHEPRFVDLAPAEIYASLLDQGRYVCSIRTLYRILAENHEVRERRRQMRHPVYVKPELLPGFRNKNRGALSPDRFCGPRRLRKSHIRVVGHLPALFVAHWRVPRESPATGASRAAVARPWDRAAASEDGARYGVAARKRAGLVHPAGPRANARSF